MIYSLNGKILHTEPTFVVIECGGVGYQCYATMNTLRTLPHIGETATIYTQMLVREDAIELCGFSTTAERNCFTMLMSISGVGAKVALAILSVLTPEQVALSVSLGDSKSLTKASGVGNIAGSYVLDGVVQRGSKARITRDGKQVFDGAIASLKRFKDDVREVRAGYECGLVFDGFSEIREGDQAEVYQMVEVARS